MENNYNYTPLTLLFSPNCLKCAIVNLKHAKKAPLGQSFCPLHPWGFLQGTMHAAWASGVLARGKRMILLPPLPKVCGHSRPMGFCEVGDAVALPPLSLFLLWGNLLLGRSKVNGRIQRAGWMVLASRMQRALQKGDATNAGRCVARCQNHVVRLGAQPTALHSRFSVIGNRFSSPWPMLPACLFSGLCYACRLLSISLLLRKKTQGNLLSPGG